MFDFNTELYLCSQISSIIFRIKSVGSLKISKPVFIFHTLFLELLERVPVRAAQTGSGASRQLIQSYPNSATLWVANTSALPHKDLCVGLMNGKILWSRAPNKLIATRTDLKIKDLQISISCACPIPHFPSYQTHLKPETQHSVVRTDM